MRFLLCLLFIFVSTVVTTEQQLEEYPSPTELVQVDDVASVLPSHSIARRAIHGQLDITSQFHN